MVANDQSLTVKLLPEEIRKIEQFVDDICDQLFINDTYYGNILMSITELFQALCQKTPGEVLKITAQPVDTEFINVIESDIDIDQIAEGEYNKNVYLIKSLVDQFEVDDNALILNFDISALHNEIYKKRAEQLQAYLKNEKVKKKEKSSDNL